MSEPKVMVRLMVQPWFEIEMLASEYESYDKSDTTDLDLYMWRFIESKFGYVIGGEKPDRALASKCSYISMSVDLMEAFVAE